MARKTESKKKSVKAKPAKRSVKIADLDLGRTRGAAAKGGVLGKGPIPS